MTTFDPSSGNQSEQMFEDVFTMYFFRSKCDDERDKHIEGEYRTRDGKHFVEVKSDFVCFSPSRATGNLPIEIYHPDHEANKGWFYHCRKNGVTDICFLCWAGSRFHCAVIIPFAGLWDYVCGKLEDKAYMKKRYRSTPGGTWNLCIPLKELRAIAGTRVIYSIDTPGIWIGGTPRDAKV